MRQYKNKIPGRTLWLLALLLISSALCVEEAYGAWYNSNWLYRQKITILPTLADANLTNFPYLVKITAAANPLFANAQADHDDILFTKSDGSTKLDHEIEYYESSAGNEELVAWVRVESLSSTDNTEIYMYYGYALAGNQENVPGVWSNGYEAVYHLHDDFNDSLSAHNGSNSGSSDVVGQIADAQDFFPGDGNDEIGLGSWSVSGSQLTIEAWIKSDDGFAEDDPRVISKAQSGAEQDHIYMMSLYNGTINENRLRFRLKTGTNDTSGTTTFFGTSPNGYLPDANQWYHVAMTYDGSQMRIIRDGLDAGSAAKTGALRENAWPVSIGNIPASSATYGAWDGKIDEVRISSVARTLDWMKTEFRNQVSPASYQTVGPEQVASSDWTAPNTIGDLATGTIAASSSELTWTAPGDDNTTGTAATYDIRYSTSPITDANWDAATPVSGEPAPQVAGSSEAFTVTGLGSGTTYYFAIKTADEVPNWSALSNVPSAATDNMIYYVRVDGNDANSGTSNSAGGAWRTIQKAADTMGAGDKVLVQPGTYNELVIPANSGSSGSPITYEADGAVILDGQSTLCYAFQVVGKDYLVIDGFEFVNYQDCGGYMANAYFEDSDFGTVKNNVFHNTGRDAIGFHATSSNCLAENNLIYDIADDGITPLGSNHTLRNNTFFNCGGWAIESAATSGNLYENNIIWDSIDNTGGSVTWSYNDYSGGVLTGTGNISTDPLFVNAATGNFYLSQIAAGQGTDSPCVDTGSATAASLGLDTRTTRTDGVADSGTVDMGYHYPSGTGPGDVTAPSAVTDLGISGAPDNTSVTLSWTAPGDDGNSGTATTYDIRYSTSLINDGNWASATQVTGEPAPQVAGSAESFTVPSLPAGTRHYFAIKTADEVPNWSALSNVVNVMISDTCDIDPNGTYIEAENYVPPLVPGTNPYTFTVESTLAGANTGTYLLSNGGSTEASPTGQRSDFPVNFTTPGTYYIWMRAHDDAGSSRDSTFVGVDAASLGALTQPGSNVWDWTNNEHFSGSPVTVALSAGTHVIKLWPRESGQQTDGLLISTSATPLGLTEGSSVGIPSGATIVNPNNCTWPPDIVILKSAVTDFDPVNGTSNPKAIPGANVLYTVAVTNQGPGATDSDTVVITDPIPSNTELFVGDINGAGSGPILFQDGNPVCGLSYVFTTLDSLTDDVEFSDNGGATYDYDPGPDADPDGFNSNVTNFRATPGGAFNASDGSNHPSFTLKFKVRVK